MNQSLHIEEVLEQKGVYVSTTAGVSILIYGRDILEKKWRLLMVTNRFCG